jgi:hypothetical protein
MAGIVDDDIEAALIGDNPGDTGYNRGVGGDIEFDRAQIDVIVPGEFSRIGDGRSVAAFRCAHAGIDGMAGLGEGAGGKSAETAGSAGDDNDLLAHDPIPSGIGVG